MKKIIHICMQDVWSIMVVPTGAVVAALFTFLCGIVFMAQVLEPNAMASMQPVFSFAAWILLVLCPAITMRLVAEERRIGTWEVLLSSPITSFELAKGKFLSALLFLSITLALTFPLVIVLEMYADVDYGEIASGYLGLLMLGSAVISTGLLISSLTTSQTVAYLVTAFFWLTMSLSMKVLPAYVPTRFADIFYAIDPDFRIEAFSIGLIDSANIVYFLTISIATGWLSILAIEKTRQTLIRTWKFLSCLVLLFISIISINGLALQNQYRVRFDATGSRAYTLSQETNDLLEQIDGLWRIVVLLDDKQMQASVVKQVDEVLRRYQDASENILVQRINPADPQSITEYDELLRELIALYASELEIANSRIEEGIKAFEDLTLFAMSTSAWSESLAQLATNEAEQDTLLTLANALAVLGQEGSLILEEVYIALAVHDQQPLPQIALARDILVAVLGQWASELSEVTWWMTRERSEDIAAICRSEVPSFDRIVAQLKQVSQGLSDLGDLELGQLATQLANGEGAIIMSPDRATMIPASMLFRSYVSGSSSIAVDQRFRGEQIISSAMRSIESNASPVVVFVHTEPRSLFVSRGDNVDLVAAKGLLEASRIKVLEWSTVKGEKPETATPTVWILIPPTSRIGLEPSKEELELIQAAKQLLHENQNIFLNFQPSLLPRYGQSDPWVTIAESLGVFIDTGKVIAERVAVGPNEVQIQRGQSILETSSQHPVARAIDGSQLYLPLPMTLTGGVPLLHVKSNEDRWLDTYWERQDDEVVFENPIQNDVIVATSVIREEGNRVILVGSGNGLFTWATDRAISVSGDGIAMLNPGNSEFLLASIEWLAGLDHWIAVGPIGQQSRRVQGLQRSTYIVWAFTLVLGIPALIMLIFTLFTLRRRQA